MKKRVVVGMSGGVDSSVAALILKESGYEVIGLFMNNWKEEEGGCCTSASDWEDVRAVAGKLNIPAYSVDLSEEYMDRVFKYFLDEYRRGRTPNPDVLCNREIKFSAFAEQAAALGADYIATGHYCAVAAASKRSVLLKATDTDKDQTYFLNQVPTEAFANVLFPLGRITKQQVRTIAERAGLVTAKKKDSTGICFIGERRFREFLMNYLPAQKGRIVDTNGKTVGEHLGLMYYTLGQRKGLGIGGVSGEEQSRWYVVDKRMNDNTLVVSCGEGEELLSDSLTASGLNVIGPNVPAEFDCTAKLRYRQKEFPARAVIKSKTLELKFYERQRAVTPGQYAVLYLGERCVGGAVIDKAFKEKNS